MAHADAQIITKVHDVWAKVLPHMRERGFPEAFLHTTPALSRLPSQIMFGVLPGAPGNSNGPQAILAISAAYIWPIDPRPKNIANLARYLKYDIVLPDDSGEVATSV